MFVLQKLVDMNNFHSSKAILSGLQSVAVYRLNQTWTVCFIMPFCNNVQLRNRKLSDGFICLTPDDFIYQGRASGWERVKHESESRRIKKDLSKHPQVFASGYINM